jgi:Cyclin, N-terminal domain
MLISAKYLEMTYPGVQKFASLTNSPFTYDDFIHAERHVLTVLNWDLSLVTSYDLLQHFIA